MHLQRFSGESPWRDTLLPVRHRLVICGRRRRGLPRSLPRDSEACGLLQAFPRPKEPGAANRRYVVNCVPGCLKSGMHPISEKLGKAGKRLALGGEFFCAEMCCTKSEYSPTSFDRSKAHTLPSLCVLRLAENWQTIRDTETRICSEPDIWKLVVSMPN